MKVHAFRVAQRGPRSLESLLNHLNDKPFAERVYSGRANGMRLEHLERRDGLVFADFAVPRSGHGPGKLSNNAPMSDIELAEGELFGEDTGMALHTASGYVALQYNHSGPRMGGIANYLFAADVSIGGAAPHLEGQADQDRFGFSFGAVLKPDAYDRLARFGIIRELAFEVSVPGVRAADRAAGRSLSDILDAPLPDGIETIQVTMRSARDGHSQLGRNGAMRWIDELSGLGNLVSGGFVKGKRDADSRVEQVDLVRDRLTNEALVSPGRGQRYTRDDRFAALGRILNEWLESGALPR